MAGFMAANFVYGIIIAILFGIVIGGWQLVVLGKKKKDKDDALALKITGYALMGIGGIPLLIAVLPYVIQGFGFHAGGMLANEVF
jgi:hypothetical protein